MKKYIFSMSKKNSFKRTLGIFFNFRQIAYIFFYTALILGCCEIAIPYAATSKYPTGLIEPGEKMQQWAEEHITKIVPKPKSASVRQLPSRVINIRYLPKVGRQFFNSCTGWATTYYHKTWQEAKEHGWERPDPAVDPEHVMSPAFTYNLNDNGENGGTSFAGNYAIIMAYGTVSCAEMAANTSPGISPTSDQIISAFPYRGQELFSLDYSSEAGFQALKEYLASGELVTIATLVYENFGKYPNASGINNEVFFKNIGDACGNHALTVIGYDDSKSYTDDNGVTHTGAILLVNSWGTNWGVNLPEAGERGFIWLSYDYFRTGSSFGSIAYYMTDRVGYQPTLIGSYHICHARQIDLSIQLCGGDRDHPEWTMDVLPFSGGPHPINRDIPFDATDYAAESQLSWWLKIIDNKLWSPPEIGTISSFRIKRLDGLIWDSPDAPVDTVDIDIYNTDSITWLNIALVYPKDKFLTNVSPASATHVWADLDGDGDADLVFFDNKCAVCRMFSNDGKGILQEMGGRLQFQEVQDIAVADINGDGLADIACNGYDNGSFATRIYYNSGDFNFFDSGVSLPSSQGSLQWLDYNRDTRLDLALCIKTDTENTVDVLLQNSDASFSRAGLDLPGSKVFEWADYNRDGNIDIAISNYNYQLFYQSNGTMHPGPTLYTSAGFSALCWGDVDNDGWLDLALVAGAGGEIWHNNRDGSFAKFAQFTSQPFTGSMAWGDVDNDGLSDLAICADFNSTQGADVNVRTQIMKNLGDGTFRNLGFNLNGVSLIYSNPELDRVQWVDYDGDGDLDLSVAGPGSRLEGAGYEREFHLYENRTSQAGGLNRINNRPQPPSTLTSTLNPDNSVTLKWSAGSDAETAAAGLNYILRIGRNPDSDDIFPPDMTAAKNGILVSPALDGTQLEVTLSDLPAAFYWSVQTIDAGYAVSDWSKSQVFTRSGAPLPGDLNNNAVIDIADVVKTARMAGGLEPPNPETADRDGDGHVGDRDVYLLENTLLGRKHGKPLVVARQTIGPQGGTLTTSGFSLIVPAGTFARSTLLYLQLSQHDRPFGADSLSPMFKVTGLPEKLYGPLTVRIKAERAAQKDVHIQVGGQTLAKDDPVNKRLLRPLQTQNYGDGWYEVVIPVDQNRRSVLTTNDRGVQKFRIADSAGTSSSLDYIGLEFSLSQGYYTVYDSSHFRFWVAKGKLTQAKLTPIADAFEYAHKTLTSPPWSFLCKTTPSFNNKIQVYLKSIDATLDGIEVTGKFSDLSSYIVINLDKVESDTLRQSAMHEFFHYLQDSYDPEPGWKKGLYGSRILWLEEASSVWSEELAKRPQLPSSVFLENVWDAIRDGLHTATIGTAGQRQSYGYGNAGLIKYLTDSSSGFNMLNMYRDISLGVDSIPAVFLQKKSPRDWWGDYVSKLMTGQVYKLPYEDAVGRIVAKKTGETRRYNIKDTHFFDDRISQSFILNLPDYSAERTKLVIVADAKTALDNSHTLSCSLKQDPAAREDALQFFMLKYRKAADDNVEAEIIGAGVNVNNALKFDVPNVKQLYDDDWLLVPLIVNRDGVAPYDGKIQASLQMAVTSDVPKQLEEFDITGFSDDEGVPTVHCAGNIAGPGWSDYEMKTIDLGYSEIPMLCLNMPGVTPVTMDITYKASLTKSSALSGSTTLNVSGIKRYVLELWEHHSDGKKDNIVELPVKISSDGHFDFVVPDDNDLTVITGSLKIVYDIIETTSSATGIRSDRELTLLIFVIAL